MDSPHTRWIPLTHQNIPSEGSTVSCGSYGAETVLRIRLLFSLRPPYSSAGEELRYQRRKVHLRKGIGKTFPNPQLLAKLSGALADKKRGVTNSPGGGTLHRIIPRDRQYPVTNRTPIRSRHDSHPALPSLTRKHFIFWEM